ncbi:MULTISPECIES: GFA family protein [Shinella]|uniref:GFA family protein n=1 Tax=Shinella sumterensis TaxID=1967501 RepID=A0AA50CND8_9HYPH|nr:MULTISPECIES: GFA family protein [Shinella]WLR98323.1 GFA family protein [Shinella sumterensis]
MNLTGHCLCRSLAFEVTGDILRTGHCHCESCRRATSSPVTTFFCVATADVAFRGDTLRHYASSPGVRRGFCNGCGSPVSFETEGRPGEIDLYVAALEDATGVEITQHWYWNERVSWLRCEDDLPKRED